MGEFILEVIGRILAEITFHGIIRGIFQFVRWIGLWMLKILTASSTSIKELGIKYQDSSAPYFLGFGVFIGIIWLLCS